MNAVMQLLNAIITRQAWAIPTLLFASSAGALAMALIAEYGFNLQPCILCIYQRIPFAFIAGLSLLALALLKWRSFTLPLLLICALAFFIDAGIAAYHTGVEYKWWTGTDECGGDTSPTSIEDLRNQILGAPTVRCDEPAFLFLGLSMAGWNVLYTLGMGGLCLYLARKIKDEKRSRK